MKKIIENLFCSVFLLALSVPVLAAVVVDRSDPGFAEDVERELNLMRDGARGVVCEALVNRLEAASATTTIKPLTTDESTWHPNDRRGTRSHVVALDTKIRGAERAIPTSAVLYLHPTRVDPKLTLFRLGTFVSELSIAADLNSGTFSGDYIVQKKRSAFFRNAWCDALGYELVNISDRLPTGEYQTAKKLGLINKEYAHQFPILDPKKATTRRAATRMDFSLLPSVHINLAEAVPGDTYYGRLSQGSSFLRVQEVKGQDVQIRFGSAGPNEFVIYEGRMARAGNSVPVDVYETGADWTPFQPFSRVVVSGNLNKGASSYSDAWEKEMPFPTEN